MRLAFLVLAHKHPDQLEQLTDYLLAQDCDVFVHIDRKSRTIFRDYITRSKSRDRLHVYSRYKVYWGGYSQIRATYFLLKESVEKSPFAFVSLISGQDLPVVPIARLREFLSASPSASYLEHRQLPIPGYLQNGWLERVQLWWITAFPRSLGFFFNRLNVLIHAAQRKLRIYRTPDMVFHAGPNWFTLSRTMAEYVVRTVEDNPSVIHRYRYTRCADEIFVQTVLMASPYAPDIVNNNLRYVDWVTGPEFPRTLRMEDFDTIVSSGAFFARKFDPEVDKSVIRQIYSRL